ncbi:YopX family protein [Bacillus siamensis]|uniref:YopX family protein n=1 Tax=Bacillus siamensis TaxID=659243 RepID=UPI002E21BE6D|nr:YopX family protein [Bacillus siamensis]MED0836082.1 YopX family protein [Bacillus siamensis]
MKTAYRVWDGEQMHYWDDVNLTLFIRGKVWTLYKDSAGLCPDIVATNQDGKSVLIHGTDQFQTNGRLKRIYAGDIVQQEETAPGGLYGPEPFIGEVKMIDGSWCIINEKKEECRPLFSETATNKDIGDVYQNPELLEGGE